MSLPGEKGRCRMKELNASEIQLVCGGVNPSKQKQAEECASNIMSSGGMGATLGGLIGGALGSIVPGFGTAAGAFLGGMLGAGLGGSAAASGPSCRAP